MHQRNWKGQQEGGPKFQLIPNSQGHRAAKSLLELGFLSQVDREQHIKYLLSSVFQKLLLMTMLLWVSYKDSELCWLKQKRNKSPYSSYHFRTHDFTVPLAWRQMTSSDTCRDYKHSRAGWNYIITYILVQLINAWNSLNLSYNFFKKLWDYNFLKYILQTLQWITYCQMIWGGLWVRQSNIIHFSLVNVFNLGVLSVLG